MDFSNYISIVRNISLFKIFSILVAVMSMCCIIVMKIDKRNAERDKKRVPEKKIFYYSFIGGALGTLIGMYIYRHKTRKWYFAPIVIIFLIGHISLWTYLYIK